MADRRLSWYIESELACIERGTSVQSYGSPVKRPAHHTSFYITRLLTRLASTRKGDQRPRTINLWEASVYRDISSMQAIARQTNLQSGYCMREQSWEWHPTPCSLRLQAWLWRIPWRIPQRRLVSTNNKHNRRLASHSIATSTACVHRKGRPASNYAAEQLRDLSVLHCIL